MLMVIFFSWHSSFQVSKKKKKRIGLENQIKTAKTQKFSHEKQSTFPESRRHASELSLFITKARVTFVIRSSKKTLRNQLIE